MKFNPEGAGITASSAPPIAAEQVFDGCYVIRAGVPKGLMAATELVLAYKSLSLVEQAFRNLKTWLVIGEGIGISCTADAVAGPEL